MDEATWQKAYNRAYMELETLIDDSKDVFDLENLQTTLEKLTRKIQNKLERLDHE